VADLPTPLGDLLGAALIGLMREHHALVGRELAPLGLHVGQEMLLDALVRGAGATQAELARVMGVEAPTVTKMLQRLEGSGLLERRPDPSDRRLVRVWPTEHARGVHAEVLRRWAGVEGCMLTGLTSEQIAAFRAIVTAMTDNLTITSDRFTPVDCPGPASALATDQGNLR